MEGCPSVLRGMMVLRGPGCGTGLERLFWTGMIIFTKASVTWLAGAFFVGKWRWRDVSGIGWVSESCEEQYKKILLDGYDRYQRRNDV